MTTPHVTEISSSRRAARFMLSQREDEMRRASRREAARELRHSYDALTPVDMDAYRARCAEIRTLAIVAAL